MGQEQSRGDGEPSRKLHPKFQNVKARGNSAASSSTASSPRSIPRPTTQTDDTRTSGSAPSESTINLQPISANIGDTRPSGSSPSESTTNLQPTSANIGDTRPSGSSPSESTTNLQPTSANIGDTRPSGSAPSESTTNLQPTSSNIGGQASFTNAPLNKPSSSHKANNNDVVKSTKIGAYRASRRSIPRLTTQTDDTRTSGSAPSESTTNLQPTSSNIGDQASFTNAPLNKPSTSHTANNNDVLMSTKIEHTNQTAYPASIQSSTLADNIRPKQNQIFAKSNNTVEVESSTSRQSQHIKNNLSFSNAVPINKKLHTPVRDIRHVPTCNEQIRLNNTSDGNPFLSTFNDNKSENESIIQNKSMLSCVPLELKKTQITERLELLYSFGVIDRMDLDKGAIESLNDLPLDDALDVLNKFVASNPKTKINKSAFLCSMIKNRINGQTVGNNKIVDQTQESRGICSQNVSFSVPSSKNKSVKCFKDNYPILTECNNIGYQGYQEVIEQIKQISSIPVVQEVPGENLFSEQNTRTQEGSEPEVRSIDSSENEHLSSDHVIKFEHNLSTTFGQQAPPVSNSKMAPKVKTQFKRSAAKNHSVKLGTLKDMDRIAESLCSFNKGGTNVFTKDISPNISLINTEDKPTSLSFEECIMQMKNVEFHSGEKLTLLHQSVCNNLKSIDSFITGLKLSLFPLNDQIISEFNILKNNIISFPTCFFEKTNSMNPQMKYSSPHTNVIEEVQQNKYTSNSNFDLYSELLNELPTEYQSERHNISFLDGYLFCKVCDKSIEFCKSNLIDHINDENHTILLKTSLQSKNLEQPQIERGQFKDSVPVSLTKRNIDHLELGKNHHGILDIIYKSFENNFPLPKTVFICLFCDFFHSDRSVLERHTEIHPTEKGEWHSCDSCEIVIYGTYAYFQIHRSSEQHLNIMKIKCKKNHSNEEVSPSELEDEKDNISVCSSNTGPKNPHEIFLLIAKKCKNKNINGPVGLYCRLCNRYFRYNTQDLACRLENHIKVHSSCSIYKSLINYHCTTCNVDLFGDQQLWSDHVNMELHNEMAGSSNIRKRDAQQENNTSAGIKSQISKEKGPHDELMNEVLKKHVNNEPSKDSFGFYCHLCEMYTFDEKEWRIHLNNASHLNRIKSSDCITKNMFNNCFICKIFLICDDSIFIQHEQSLAHKALSKLQNPRKDLKGAQLVNEESSQSESDESDDENEGDKFSESHSTSSSIQNTINDKRTPIGVNITSNNLA